MLKAANCILKLLINTQKSRGTKRDPLGTFQNISKRDERIPGTLNAENRPNG
jgi:hypothetical protein